MSFPINIARDQLIGLIDQLNRGEGDGVVYSSGGGLHRGRDI